MTIMTTKNHCFLFQMIIGYRILCKGSILVGMSSKFEKVIMEIVLIPTQKIVPSAMIRSNVFSMTVGII